MGAGLTLKLNKTALTSRVKKRIAFNLGTVGRFLVSELRSQVAIPFPPASMVGKSPHRRSGDLQRSFKFDVKTGLISVTLRVFTNIAYALRLEFGFVGTDSLGRNINQGPRPYWRVVMAQNRHKIGVGVAVDP